MRAMLRVFQCRFGSQVSLTSPQRSDPIQGMEGTLQRRGLHEERQQLELTDSRWSLWTTLSDGSASLRWGVSARSRAGAPGALRICAIH